MSRLKELIERLCPDGVEYKPLGELGTFERGNGLQKKDFTENGVGCIHYGQIYTYYSTFATETKSFVSEELANKLLPIFPGNLVIACTSENVEDVGKAVAWLGTETIVTGGHSVVFRHSLNPKYVAYFFQTENFFIQKKKFAFGAKVIDIKAADLAKIVIPVPPIEVQEEIVRILDRFADYAASLQAELQARKEQYEYYRNLLLTFNPSACGCGTDGEQEIKVTTPPLNGLGATWKPMSEIAKIMNGKDYKHIEKGGIPVYGSGGIMTYIKDYMYDEESVLLPRKGSIGKIYYVNNKFWTVDTIYWTKINQKIIKPKFLYYFLKTQNTERKAIKAGAVPSMTQEIYNKIIIPIPPIEVQEKIVAILDRFETLVNDLTQGLPAEIAAVRERYEYYRNKLLTFKRIA